VPSRIAKESTIERKLVRQLREQGCMVLKLNVQGHRGFPDLLVIPPDGNIYFIEVKRPKRGRFSKLQEVTIRDLRKRGVTVDIYTAQVPS
jgi:Holliday junction resolvase